MIRTEFQGGQNFGALPINDGEWHHVACVFPDGATEGSEILHYIDGVIDPQAGGTSQSIDTAVGEGLAPWTDGRSSEAYYVHFGAVLAHGFGRMLEGSMADVRIYDEELSEDEIIDIMEGVDTGVPVDPGGASLSPGDVNGDGNFDIADMVAQLNFLFGGGGGLPECYVVPDSDPVALNSSGLALLDYNGDGNNNIADAVAGLGGLFGGGGPHALGADCAEIEGSCESNCVQ